MEVGRAFGSKAVLTTGFGLEGSVLLHMIASRNLPIRLVTLDTGLFFEETYATWRRLEETLGVEIEAVRPRLDLEVQANLHGPRLWTREPNLCCGLRKLEPLGRALEGAQVWLTGIRRDQTPERAEAPRVGYDEARQITKVNPLVAWTEADVRAYLEEHRVPYNPLFDQGFPSIGCEPCTRPVQIGGNPRSGRWAGFEKRECGLHWDEDGRAVPRRSTEATS